MERGHKKSNAPLKKYKVGLGVLKFAEGNLEGSRGCGGGEGEGGGLDNRQSWRGEDNRIKLKKMKKK